ncbi:putative ribonuclease H protein [Nymphaea thermarum]|nr:putative ribonuclease H protein [Nymphaea thermarum]
MGKSKKQFNPDEPLNEETTDGEAPQKKDAGQQPNPANDKVVSMKKEMQRMRNDWVQADKYRKKDVDRHMDEMKAMITALTANMNFLTERVTQNLNTSRDKGKGILNNPNYPTDTEIDPNNFSRVETSAEGARRKMQPPPNQPLYEPHSEYYNRTPRKPRWVNGDPNRMYNYSEGEQDESPDRPKEASLRTEVRVLEWSLSRLNDVIMLVKASRGTINTIKVILEDFERLARMKVNKQKSEIFAKTMVDCQISEIQWILQWTNGHLPSKYLGLSLFLGRLTEDLCLPLLTKVEKRLAAWKARLLSYAGRLCLIRYVLMSLPYYWMMGFRLPKVVIRKIQQACIKFLWNDEEGARYMHLVKWDRMCMPVEEGGVGIHRLEEVNRAMLASRCCRLLTSGDPWANLFKEKYLRYHSLWTFKRATNQSWGWKGLRWGWTWIQDKVEWRLGNGECVRFWTDRWSRQVLLTRADGRGYVLHGNELITSVREFTSASQGSPSLDIVAHLGVFKDDIRLRDANDSLVWSDDDRSAILINIARAHTRLGPKIAGLSYADNVLMGCVVITKDKGMIHDKETEVLERILRFHKDYGGYYFIVSPIKD